jgi:F0F1-type ATP synthase membrane subunit c/vacuolar-type H+-ATPase subunit K
MLKIRARKAWKAQVATPLRQRSRRKKPEIAGQALIFIALAEGLVVFGFITALMILGKI